MSGFERRRFLLRGLQLSAVALLSKTAVAECVDPDELSDSMQGMRESLEYTDSAPDPKKTCNACSFFKPSGVGETCGNCTVLNGAVSAKGHCVSWTMRS